MVEERARRTAERWVAITLSVAAGAGLLYLAVPRLAAALASLPGDRVYAEVQDGRTPPRGAYDELVGARQRSLEWVENGRYWSDIGAAHLMIARYGHDAGDADKAELARAAAAIRAGLAAAPADAFAWARLALVLFMHDGAPSPPMADALRMSLLTGGYDERLVLTRLDLSFVALGLFSADDRDLLRQQVRYAWKISPQQVVEMGRHPLRRGFIAAALSESLEALASFESEVVRRGSR